MIVKAFNLPYLAIALSFAVFAVVFSVIFRKTPLKTRRIAIAALYIAALVGFYFYKLGISHDTAYHILISGGEFTWLNELPLNLCNIILVTMPIAVLTMSRPLLAFNFFCSFVGPLAALLMPGNGFNGYSLWLPRMMGYYATHYIALMAGTLLVSLGIYRPKMKDIIPASIIVIALSFVIFIINVIMRRTGANPYANYFYTVDPEGNFILEYFRSLIPIPYVYAMLTLLLIEPIFLIICGVFNFGFKISDKRKANNA